MERFKCLDLFFGTTSSIVCKQFSNVYKTNLFILFLFTTITTNKYRMGVISKCLAIWRAVFHPLVGE